MNGWMNSESGQRTEPLHTDLRCTGPSYTSTCLDHRLHLLLLHDGHIVQGLLQGLLQLLDVIQEALLLGGLLGARGGGAPSGGQTGGGRLHRGGGGGRAPRPQLLNGHVLQALQDLQGLAQLPEAPRGALLAGLVGRAVGGGSSQSGAWMEQ